MKFKIAREKLIEPLQLVCGVVERRQTSPILANILIVAEEHQLKFTGTDEEVELVATVDGAEMISPGEVTVPARKLSEICRNLPGEATMTASLSGGRVCVESGRFSSLLATRPVGDFPNVEMGKPEVSLELPAADLVRLLGRVSFAMAQQDARYFFNGVLVHVDGNLVRLVATNGQRLATSYVDTGRDNGQHQFILPRKAVSELDQILGGGGETSVELEFTRNHMRCDTAGARLVSKLIDATYPDYNNVIPAGGDKVMLADRRELKDALSRTAILANEIYRNVSLALGENRLDMHANNPLQEEAEETVAVEYQGEALEIGFNVTYLIDALNAMDGEKVSMTFGDTNAACRMEDTQERESVFVVSPMAM